MKKIISFSVVVFLLSFGQAAAQKSSKKNSQPKVQNIQKGNPVAEKWVKENVENLYNNFDDRPMTKEQYMQKQLFFFTQKYFDFKSDLASLTYNRDGMTETKFLEKWNKDYPMKDSKSDEVLLFGRFDYDKIAVSDIRFLKKVDDKLWYSFFIEDTKSKKKLHKKILLAPIENSFRIDEVRNVQ
ncbi:hypothetical protein ATE47_12660 [Chryseobacterium sp. IHB B 17019]|uniref:hypothetical protein n=1 Tax=Chryseobacterium sp. IHB B 17019 TaxID=1721091 RepID=UPI00071FE44A|nr:hypothetical protein [Chryseobacterium sp. IHB B 17019]ALR31319.1 hypothetical protein ATE47_12660 [Chryseobacterium sp. IHB B 17019]